ncbi:MAG TPA: lipoyl(octanoyl) transferase LipB [Nitrososphaerales archaeon]|nr:lipoyl(octanoyl) transferase LipB [Nitrososphaerales archaeon]
MQTDHASPRIERNNSRCSLMVYDLGFSEDYKEIWDFQKRLVELRNQNQTCDSLIMVEHSHVLTLGRNGHRENVLTEDLPLFEIERGGDITYHGPGQLVVYPIISLQDFSIGVKQYVVLLEQVLVDTLLHFGISSEGKLGQQTGVWVDGLRKIASIGVATSHWTTYHGFALNVNTDLSYFQRIRPCGFESSVMTSISKELGRPVPMNEVKEKIVSSFSQTFEADLVQNGVNRNNFKTLDSTITTP